MFRGRQPGRRHTDPPPRRGNLSSNPGHTANQEDIHHLDQVKVERRSRHFAPDTNASDAWETDFRSSSDELQITSENTQKASHGLKARRRSSRLEDERKLSDKYGEGTRTQRSRRPNASSKAMGELEAFDPTLLQPRIHRSPDGQHDEAVEMMTNTLRDSFPKSFGDNFITGGSSVHIGDHISFNLGHDPQLAAEQEAEDQRRKQKQEKEREVVKIERAKKQRKLEQQQRIEQFTNSFCFSNMDIRFEQISESHPKTFEWIFSAIRKKEKWDDFMDWLNDKKPIYWVFGKPGSGKSTLMKFIASHHRTKELLVSRSLTDDILKKIAYEDDHAKAQLDDSGNPNDTSTLKAIIQANEKTKGLLREFSERKGQFVLHFYFWLNGTEMQRSLKGCLCTLLYQLMQADEQLVTALLSEDKRRQEKRFISHWSSAELLKLLPHALRLTKSPFYLFLDGLDEFDRESDVHELFQMVESISNIDGAKVCVSSRPDWWIQQVYKVHPKLRLQDFTENDIRMLAEDKLLGAIKRLRMKSLNDTEKRQMVDTIVHGAEGVFIWAVVAIRTVLIGLNKSDGIHTLHERMKQLPKEMEQLYEQMWGRLQNDRRFYRDETTRQFSLAEQLPMSLLHFTLAADTKLLGRCNDEAQGMSRELLRAIISACKRMVSRIHIVTGGLLEVVFRKVELDEEEETIDEYDLERFYLTSITGRRSENEAEPENPSTVRYPLCTCVRRYEETEKCVLHKNRSTQMLYIHGTQVQYMHRSVADFIRQSKFTEDMLRLDKKVRAGAWQSFAKGRIVAYAMGCECISGAWLESTLVELCCKLVNEEDFRSLAKSIMRTGQLLPSQFATNICPYGWSHFFSKTVGPKWKLATFRNSTHYYDFPGLLASLGAVKVLGDFLGSPGKQCSAYYKSYLLMCCCKGLQDYGESAGPRQEERFGTMKWLLREHADLYTDHVTPAQPGTSALVRQPIAQCLMFLVRLLLQGEGTVHKRMEKFDNGIAILQRRSLEEAKPLLWCIGSSPKHFDLDLVINQSSTTLYTILLKLETLELYDYMNEKLRQQFEDESTKRKFKRVPSINKAIIIYHQTDEDYAIVPGDNTLRTVSVLLDDLIKDLLKHETLQKASEQAWSKFVGELCLQAQQGDDFFFDVNARESFILDFGSDFRSLPFAVPPDYSKKVNARNWYEDGELRQWHERRRRFTFEASEDILPDENPFRGYEVDHELVPSYENIKCNRRPKKHRIEHREYPTLTPLQEDDEENHASHPRKANSSADPETDAAQSISTVDKSVSEMQQTYDMKSTKRRRKHSDRQHHRKSKDNPLSNILERVGR